MAVDSQATEHALDGAAVRLCMDAVPAMAAILGPTGESLWSNSRWREETRGPDAGERERRSLIDRVRRTRAPLRFRDVRSGRPLLTSAWPLDGGRVLVVSAPRTGEWDEPSDELPYCELVDSHIGGRDGVDSLTKREREVMRLLAGGLTIRAAAARLGVSVKTIEGHRDAIYRKLGVRNRAQVAAAAMQAGITTLPMLRRDAAPITGSP